MVSVSGSPYLPCGTAPKWQVLYQYYSMIRAYASHLARDVASLERLEQAHRTERYDSGGAKVRGLSSPWETGGRDVLAFVHVVLWPRPILSDPQRLCYDKAGARSGSWSWASLGSRRS